MVRISKEQYYLDIAFAVSKRSNCIKRHYGAVIVNNDEIIATGYNGSPRGEVNCCDLGFCNRLHAPSNSGDYSLCHSVHVEQNALLSAPREKILGAKMYLAGEELDTESYEKEGSFIYNRIKECKPCPICERMIKNSGIEVVIGDMGFCV